MREDLARLETEKLNNNTRDIDVVPTLKVLEMINDEDQTVAFKIREQLPSIEKLTNAYIETLNNGGRIFYIGCGTSGRLAFIDAAELVPTYGLPEGLVEGIIAGGLPAMRRAKEFAEDQADEGSRDLKEYNFEAKDMLIGVAASGRTPYVINALQYARSIGAKTGSLSCVSDAEISKLVDYPIEVVTGQEVVMGSTRMKAGTAEKLVLNMISTAACVRTGRTYKNLTVSIPRTEKTYYRKIRSIAQELGKTEEEVKVIFDQVNHDPKITMFMIKSGLTKEECEAILEKNGGRLRDSLRSIGLD